MGRTLSQAIAAHIGAEPGRIAKVAKEGHARIMVTDPKPHAFVRRVDGVRDAPEDAVRPDGIIIYTYSRLQPIIDFALETLRGLSPVESGAYRDAHTLFVGGAAAEDVSGAVPGEYVFIINPLAYARKIEAGRMKMKVSGSDHVYEQAMQLVKRRFGNQAWIKFTYQSVSAGAFTSYVSEGRKGKTGIVRGEGGRIVGNRSKGRRSAAAAAEADVRRPALSFRMIG